MVILGSLRISSHLSYITGAGLRYLLAHPSPSSRFKFRDKSDGGLAGKLLCSSNDLLVRREEWIVPGHVCDEAFLSLFSRAFLNDTPTVQVHGCLGARGSFGHLEIIEVLRAP